ncbi:basic amino acid/polyamine antiporter [Pseudovibrio exalbescens]|nr:MULTISPECIES: basic amino acid/polyamine antiporter [Pseudovibrio]MDD7911995.1 basic amino acid/polyamine antiporter [Pseudovibrio exalbescens]MDX5595476.1 basic amino acid/polyamine antiporter [Pseudovibrio sp. SPO723]
MQPEHQQASKISLFALTAMVIGSMVGAGIFNLPGRFGMATGPFGAIIAWLIAGTGMYMLARVFQFLAERKPEIDAGVFAYAKAGFGDYMGFLSAFGYWLGSCLGNVFYWVLIGSTLGKFFPMFGEGNTLISILVSLAGVWLFHTLILRGVEQAAAVNFIVTIAKIVPILVAIIAMIIAFNFDTFRENFWGGVGMPEKPLIFQVRDTMLITVFVFIGIEGASVYSRFAKKRSDVGTATILGFVAVTGLMVAITLLPYAIEPRAEIAALRQPSLAGALEAAAGPWGRWFISIGVLVSVLGAYLAWCLICAEVMFAAAKSGDMPRIFANENANKVPAAALWATNIVISAFIISTYWSADAFNFMLNMTSVTTLLPYLLVAGFGALLVRDDALYAGTPKARRSDMIVSWIAILYVVFMFIAAGLKYVILVTVLFAPGTLLYVWSRRENNASLFNKRETMIFAAIAIGAILGMAGLITGRITP